MTEEGNLGSAGPALSAHSKDGSASSQPLQRERGDAGMPKTIIGGYILKSSL